MESLDNQCFISFIFQKKEEILNTLTNQELKILKLASTDLTNKEISNQLCITPTMNEQPMGFYGANQQLEKFNILQMRTNGGSQ